MINSFNYIPIIDKVFDGSNSQVRVDEIIVWNNIDYTLQVSALGNDTVRISLVDYTVAIKGKFTNTLRLLFYPELRFQGSQVADLGRHRVLLSNKHLCPENAPATNQRHRDTLF
jgi:hypothetical protein